MMTLSAMPGFNKEHGLLFGTTLLSIRPADTHCFMPTNNFSLCLCFMWSFYFFVSGPTTAHLLHFWGAGVQGVCSDTGEPGYKAIYPARSFWQLQEVTATFLAHCLTAVKWHMSTYSWAVQLQKKKKKKKAPVWNRNERPETKKRWHHHIKDSTRRGNGHCAWQGDTEYYVHSEVCTCTMNARIHATKYARAQMLSCCSCQCHLCRRGHTGVRTMELYETEALSQWASHRMWLCTATSMSAPWETEEASN